MNFKVLADSWIETQRTRGNEPNSLPNLGELREAQRQAHQDEPADTVVLSDNARE
jgi:hypothetical protein